MRTARGIRPAVSQLRQVRSEMLHRAAASGAVSSRGVDNAWVGGWQTSVDSGMFCRPGGSHVASMDPGSRRREALRARSGRDRGVAARLPRGRLSRPAGRARYGLTYAKPGRGVENRPRKNLLFRVARWTPRLWQRACLKRVARPEKVFGHLLVLDTNSFIFQHVHAAVRRHGASVDSAGNPYEQWTDKEVTIEWLYLDESTIKLRPDNTRCRPIVVGPGTDRDVLGIVVVVRRKAKQCQGLFFPEGESADGGRVGSVVPNRQ